MGNLFEQWPRGGQFPGGSAWATGLGIANSCTEGGTMELPCGPPLGNVPGVGTSIGNSLGLWGMALEWPVPLGIPVGSGALEWPVPWEVCSSSGPGVVNSLGGLLGQRPWRLGHASGGTKLGVAKRIGDLPKPCPNAPSPFPNSPNPDAKQACHIVPKGQCLIYW